MINNKKILPSNDEDFKVLLINISLRPNSKVKVFPIGLGYIATAIYNAGFNFEILDLDKLRFSDSEIEEYIRNAKFDVVAMGCIVTGYKYVKKISEIIKKYKDVPIIVGNSVATSIPNIIMNRMKVDIGVVGEGDKTIIELLKALRDNISLDEVKGIFYKKNNEVIFTPPREIIQNLGDLPFIKYDLFDIKFYLEKGRNQIPEPYPIEFEKIKALPVNTARGCPFKCGFCYHVFRNVKYRTRSIEHIGQEIKFLIEKFGVNYILFCDELSLFTRKRAYKLADYIISNKLDFFWIADCRAGLFREEDLDLALKLKKAGCISLGYSLESADDVILAKMNKKITVKDFIIQTRVLYKAGINTSTSLVIGYPEETPETLQKTFDVCYENDIYPSAGYLLPQPGTPIYDYALETGKIKDEEEYLLKMGDRQDFTINLTNMKQEEIESIVKKNLKKISEKLKLNIEEEKLIKSGHYRQKKI